MKHKDIKIIQGPNLLRRELVQRKAEKGINLPKQKCNQGIGIYKTKYSGFAKGGQVATAPKLSKMNTCLIDKQTPSSRCKYSHLYHLVICYNS